MKQTADEILQKHEDANEMHFHQVDREWIIQAMEEYAQEKSEKPINLEGNKTAVQWFANQLGITTGTMLEQAIEIERGQHKDTYVSAMARPVVMDKSPFDQAEQYYNETYAEGKTL